MLSVPVRFSTRAGTDGVIRAVTDASPIATVLSVDVIGCVRPRVPWRHVSKLLSERREDHVLGAITLHLAG